jgi:catechol 2,3-dioxygenase-like lactoylglutathione lyase family enzyme
MLTGFDHIVILSDDLEQAKAQFERLGFTVTPGGRHPRFTHNALVPFQDGTYLELIAFYEHPDEGSTETHRWHHHLATGGGLVDFAIAATDLDVLIADADARGVTTSGAQPGARKRPDGQEIRWRSTMQSSDNVGALPFIIQDVTERGLRVPLEAAEHANGVRGIQSLVVAVADLDAAIKRYCALLDREAPSGENLKNLVDAEGIYFLIGPHRVDVATPTGPGPMQELLDRRGDSIYELTLLGRENVDIDPGDASNARIRIVAG